MTVLYGRFDPITGALLETALSEKMDELWREEDPRARCNPGQRMADALAYLVTREETDQDTGKVRGPRLLLIADYDVDQPSSFGTGVWVTGLPSRQRRSATLPVSRRSCPPSSRGVLTAVGPGTGTADRQSRTTGRPGCPGQGLCGVWRHCELVSSTPVSIRDGAF